MFSSIYISFSGLFFLANSLLGLTKGSKKEEGVGDRGFAFEATAYCYYHDQDKRKMDRICVCSAHWILP